MFHSWEELYEEIGDLAVRSKLMTANLSNPPFAPSILNSQNYNIYSKVYLNSNYLYQQCSIYIKFKKNYRCLQITRNQQLFFAFPIEGNKSMSSSTSSRINATASLFKYTNWTSCLNYNQSIITQKISATLHCFKLLKSIV